MCAVRSLFAVAVLFTVLPAAAQKCRLSEHTEYDKKIREYTTESFFLTELVDHLPLSSCVPSPDTHLQRIVGAPDKLTYVADINAYMRLLASKSPRVRVEELGKSEEGRDMLLVIISDEQNLARLDRYRQITARLADPRGLSDPEAQKLIAEGKPMYWAATGIHSPETGGPEMFMELAYRLAVEETPFIQKIRRDAIILLTPVIETDGRDRMVDIYLHRKRNPKDQPYPLVWWGHYVAHDNNRDGMTLSLALSRNMMRGFMQYHPQVFHDLHESIPYLYISTGTGPYNAWLDPITINEWQQMAYHEVTEMTKRGVVGVWTHGFYDGWAPNYLFYMANGHNAIGRFYETFGNGGADTRVRRLRPNQTSRQWYRPNPPLDKVKWSLRNHVNLAQSALLLGMHNLASNGPKFLENFYLKGKRSVAKARNEGPAAWIFPADDPRPAEQARLLNLLKMQGVEVHRADKEIVLPEKEEKKEEKKDESKTSESAQKEEPKADEKKDGDKKEEKKKEPPRYAAGSYVVRMDQPYSRMADMMLDTQYYNPKDPRSYDDTGWTFGALRNVKTVRVADAAVLDVPMTKVEGEVRAPGAVEGSGSTFVINHNTDNTLVTLRYRLRNQEMLAAEEPFEVDGRKFVAGSIILRNADRAALEKHAQELGLKVLATSGEIKAPTHPLAAPRIALLHSWQSTQNDGWYRIALDTLEVPYTYLAETKVRGMSDLRQQFDVIIVPPVGSGLGWWLRGLPVRGDKPLAWKNSPETPNLHRPGLSEADDIRGGLGYAGLANLQKFVAEGGLLIGAAAGARLPVEAGMAEMVSIAETRQLQAPGSVLLAKFEDKKSPIAYGYGDQLYVYFRQAPVFRVGLNIQFPSFFGDDTGRPSGRGSPTDADIPQGRKYIEPEKPVKRSPREQEAYIPEDFREFLRGIIPARAQWPRVVLRFAAEKELMLSGMMVGASEVAEKPAVVQVPHGKGHVVLFANNPMWRDETQGSFFLMFNAMLNYQHLDLGRETGEQDEKESAF